MVGELEIKLTDKWKDTVIWIKLNKMLSESKLKIKLENLSLNNTESNLLVSYCKAIQAPLKASE